MLRAPTLGSLLRCDYLVRPDLGLPHRSKLKRPPSEGAFFLTGTLNPPGYTLPMTYSHEPTVPPGKGCYRSSGGGWHHAGNLQRP
jgi:hypothetical protein